MPGLDEIQATPRPTRPWCLFQSGPRAYAIGLESVAEVVEVEKLVRLPQSPPRVVGLCTLRREVMPVIGLGPGLRSDAGRHTLLILRTGHGPWALEVSSEGTTVAEDSLDGTPSDPDPDSPGTAFLGTIRRGETAYAVIDPEATWRGVRAEVETWYTDQRVRGPAGR